ncbi:hypothetical protein BDK51DRAFT_49645, partial [Blyttiomyces helicus]
MKSRTESCTTHSALPAVVLFWKLELSSGCFPPVASTLAVIEFIPARVPHRCLRTMSSLLAAALSFPSSLSALAANLAVRLGLTGPVSTLPLPQPDDITLSKLNGQGEFKASELWADRPCLVLVVRRPGCALCREEAADVAKLRETIS